MEISAGFTIDPGSSPYICATQRAQRKQRFSRSFSSYLECVSHLCWWRFPNEWEFSLNLPVLPTHWHSFAMLRPLAAELPPLETRGMNARD